MITDGLDRDAGTGLAAEMDRLHRSCRKLIWLNPLLRYEGFEPRSLGMKAMLPYVDEFRPVHNLESLETLINVISEAAQRQSAAAMARESYAPRDEAEGQAVMTELGPSTHESAREPKLSLVDARPRAGHEIRFGSRKQA